MLAALFKDRTQNSMATAEAPEPRPNDPLRSRGHRARGGRPWRGRGGRGGRGNHQGNHQVAERSNDQHRAAVPTSVLAIDQSASNTTRDGSAPRGRGRRGARGSRSERTAIGGGQRTTIAASRAFGGRLTAETGPEDQTSESPTSLNASASTFVPGQPFVQPR